MRVVVIGGSDMWGRVDGGRAAHDRSIRGRGVGNVRCADPGPGARRATVAEAEARAAWDHIAPSPNCSIAKAERLLEYRPRYSSLEAVYEAAQWLIEDGQVTSGIEGRPRRGRPSTA